MQVLVAFAVALSMGQVQAEQFKKVFEAHDLAGLKRMVPKEFANTPAADGKTALYRACEYRWRLGAEYLLSAGAKPNVLGPSGVTPLMLASSGMDTTLVKKLIKAGAKVRFVDNRGSTALHYCVNWTQYDMYWDGQEEAMAANVKVLAQAGAEINAPDGHGRTPLMWAAGWRHLPSLKALIALRARLEMVDSKYRSALTWCASEGNSAENVQALLKAGANPSFLDLLILGCRQQAEALPFDYEWKSLRGPWDEDALSRAAGCGSVKIVKLLLVEDMDPNRIDDLGQTSLFWATGSNRISGQMGLGPRFEANKFVGANAPVLIKMLISAGANPNAKIVDRDSYLSAVAKGETPLFWAVGGGNLEAAKALIEGGADVNLSSERMEPLVEIAAEQLRLDLVELLVSKGVKVEGTEALRETMSARPKGPAELSAQEAIAELLLKHRGAMTSDLIIQVSGHATPRTVAWLLRHGQSANAVNSYGYTPLHSAASDGNVAVIELLLAYGANRDAKNKQGKAPADVAREFKHSKAYELLKPR